MNFHKKSIIDLIGNTPIVCIDSMLPIPLYLKMENLNPGGSIKDRTALYMINEAEKNGLLNPGGTIVEASSGNQGAAAAMIGNTRGYKTIITMSEKVSQEKQSVFQAFGSKIVLCKSCSDFNNPDHYHKVAQSIAQNTPNSYFLNQYFNQQNADAHFHHLAPEIDRQMGNELTHIFLAMGSGGTALGVARYMKLHRPNIKVSGVDSVHSFLATNGNPRPYYLDGMGIDYATPLYDKELLHETIFVEDQEAFDVLKLLARQYGILGGPSTGGVIAGVLKRKDQFKQGDKVLVIVCDSGRNYLSKSYYN